MIRSWAILLLILTAAISSISSFPSNHGYLSNLQTNNRLLPSGDPNGTRTAFNYTYSQANLYTNTSSPPPSQVFPSNKTGTSFVWQSTVTRTSTNGQIPGSGFLFNLTGGQKPGKESITWNVTVPKFNCQACTGVSVDFDFSGSLTKGSNASYFLSLFPPNSTLPFKSKTFLVSGFFPTNRSATCPQLVCLDVSSYVGYHLNLTFAFGWNSTTGAGMFAQVGEITVAAIGGFIQSSSNYMQVDPLDSTLIRHTAQLNPINYNSSLTTRLRPSNSNTTLAWDIGVVSIYYPSGYTIKTISLNSTPIYPALPEVPFETKNCSDGPSCTQNFIAINMTDFKIAAHNSTITIVSSTSNTLRQMATLSAGVSTQLYAPGDTVTLNATIIPSVSNVSLIQRTGNFTVTFFDPNNVTRTLSGQTFPTLTATSAAYNVFLPSDCSLCGTWSLFANFTSHFDLGIMKATFRLDLLQVTQGTYAVSGDNTALTVQGALTNSSSKPVPTAVGMAFAIDAQTPASLPVTTTGSAGSGLYLSNITLINAVFTSGQSLVMTFTIVNPTSTAYNATVIIEHEWPGNPPQTHGAFANFTLGLGDAFGDLPFNSGSPQTYQALISPTLSGLQLTLTNLTNRSVAKTIPVSLGTSPVSPTESHAGLFKITVATRSGSSTVSTNSLTSPAYAYVVGLPSVPSRFLAASPVFNGTSFSVKITSDAVVGAKKLVVFVLARDSSGRILASNSLNPGFTDSTVLTASMDSIGQVAKGQTATATLHLTSNATKISQIITVDLNIQGQGMVAQQPTVTIAPGTTQTVSLTFTAPSTPGQYALSFSSPQYNGNVALATQTLQVTITQSNLQILIPAAIGIVVAIIVLGVYLIKRQPESVTEEETKTRPGDQKTRPAPKNPPTKSLTQAGKL